MVAQWLSVDTPVPTLLASCRLSLWQQVGGPQHAEAEWLRGWLRVTPRTQDSLGRVLAGALTPRPPPADCLLMLAYRDRAERAKGLRERSSLTLEDICGLEPGLAYEGLAHTLAIVCLSQAVMLGFDSREAMCAWDARIRYALGEGEWPRAWAQPPSLRTAGRRAGCLGGGALGLEAGLEGVEMTQGRAGCCHPPWGLVPQGCTPPRGGMSVLSTRETPNREGRPVARRL